MCKLRFIGQQYSKTAQTQGVRLIIASSPLAFAMRTLEVYGGIVQKGVLVGKLLHPTSVQPYGAQKRLENNGIFGSSFARRCLFLSAANSGGEEK
mmetsp:Transcript_112711/g.177357  ORF Transcript_112711/g.177357 Transcript_112711/m.177357 type:complete len:95 (+) Transcript_112711:189-473(+)